MSTLVYHCGALGDFITTLPALAWWKQHHQKETVTLLGNPIVGVLGLESCIIDTICDITSTQFNSLFSTPNISPGTWLAKFSNAILFCAPDSPLLQNAKAIIPAVYNQPPFPSERIHIIDYHISLWTELPYVKTDIFPFTLQYSSKLFHDSFQFIPDDINFVAIHPGSGSPKKNWGTENFIELAQRFRADGFRIAWIKGPAEDTMHIPHISSDFFINISSLPLLSVLLNRSKLFIGNDSGITHLASVSGCPTVAIFGPSDPLIWQPKGPNVRVIYLAVECSPCHKQKHSFSCQNECLDEISVDKVFEVAKKECKK